MEIMETIEGVEAVEAGIGFTLDQLEKLLKENPVSYLVEGLLPADDVHVAVGDSGLGKTPWAYQLGLCVAAGMPFLGHAVRPSRVLYYDLENGSEEILQVSRALCGHLGIPSFPKDFFVIPNDGSVPEIEKAVADRRPDLVIVDTLRALHPEAEMDNSRMAAFLERLRATARTQHCTILLLHHIRKPGELGMPKLEDTETLEWLLQAAGARSLINQTNTRIAFDKRKGDQREDVSLVMKSFVKLKGESGTLYLERAHDLQGEPIGYRRLCGVGLLGNPEQEAAFEKLPPTPFRFKEAKQIYNKADDPTKKWLDKCIAAGLIRKVSRGLYERTEGHGGPRAVE